MPFIGSAMPATDAKLAVSNRTILGITDAVPVETGTVVGDPT